MVTMMKRISTETELSWTRAEQLIWGRALPMGRIVPSNASGYEEPYRPLVPRYTIHLLDDLIKISGEDLGLMSLLTLLTLLITYIGVLYNLSRNQLILSMV